MSLPPHIRISHRSLLRSYRARYARFWPLIPIGLVVIGLAVAGALLVLENDG